MYMESYRKDSAVLGLERIAKGEDFVKLWTRKNNAIVWVLFEARFRIF